MMPIVAHKFGIHNKSTVAKWVRSKRTCKDKFVGELFAIFPTTSKKDAIKRPTMH
jgi:transposase-like protein